jgi:hypothetical protein
MKKSNLRIDPATSAASLPAEVTITVIRFSDVLSAKPARGGRGTGYTLKLRKKHPQVSLKGDDIYVKSPGAIIRFTLTPSPGEKESYFPLGIAFVREGECNRDDLERLGLLNFPQGQTRVDGHSLVIADSYKDDEPNIRYKFSVVVQRGSDGRIGIIDPGIRHEPD